LLDLVISRVVYQTPGGGASHHHVTLLCLLKNSKNTPDMII